MVINQLLTGMILQVEDCSNTHLNRTQTSKKRSGRNGPSTVDAIAESHHPQPGSTVLKGGGCSRGGGGTLGNSKDSVWEDWGTLGKITWVRSSQGNHLLRNNGSE